MSGLGSALFAMAFTSVAWYAKAGAMVGLLLGGALAYVAIARVLRAGAAPGVPVWARRGAPLACLLWGAILPAGFASAGLLWGLSHGLAHMVEGPLSTAIRGATLTVLDRADTTRAAWLKHYPLAKQLGDSELALAVRAAPDWLSDLLARDEVAMAWTQAGGVAIPPQVLAFLRQELRVVVRDRASWLVTAAKTYQSRPGVAPGTNPTTRQTIEAMVAPPVFQHAATAIRTRVGWRVRKIVLVSLGLSFLVAGVLRLLWALPRRRTGDEAVRG